MVRSHDGRLVSARKNGYCFVSVFDERREEFTLDFAHGRELADALEHATPYRTGSIHGQEVELRVLDEKVGEGGVTPGRLLLGPRKHQPHGQPRQPTGPWQLSIDDGVKLADEIRAAINE